jgi:hypothetical protein
MVEREQFGRRVWPAGYSQAVARLGRLCGKLAGRNARGFRFGRRERPSGASGAVGAGSVAFLHVV